MKTKTLLIFLAALLTGACASMRPENKQGQAASAVDYLFSDQDAATPVRLATVAELRVPLRIGIAFVPDIADPRFRITEAGRQELLEGVRQAFSRYPFVSHIEVIPSTYLLHRGGFGNLERVADMLSHDCVVLLSYDQMQFAEPTAWSWLYFTGIGLYVVPADRYDVMTSVEAAVFDVRSRKVLMRAGGTSKVMGTATMMGFAETARAARNQGMREAMQKLIPSLHAEVKAFRERAPGDQRIRLDLPPGYDPKAVRATLH